MDDVLQVIKDQIAQNPVLLYMKGTPQFPQCGFSAQVVEAMTKVNKPFAYVNILEAPEIRESLKEYANWPTYPQLWVSGELVGGCDIIMEMFRSGQLQTLVESAAAESDAE
ncbi:glutaredoxin-like protein [Alcanivorax balearicus MACL04]|uniref:Glutaredoxin n=1 Tax=Alloalcanivorax balearicus MACL04 TaxID=1177182 RepID=A0ABT2QVH5_9GAMM|nr:Grx4 family monothiol glutaredoxin [Alloalcanivorax balearicus]MCU5781507.1 glutaredoxin-like protein [Alloalcanivorax balearicus MACL04]